MKILALFISGILAFTALYSEDFINYKVKENDTPEKISQEQLSNKKNWSEVLKYNKIDSSKKIKTGLVIKIPNQFLKTKEKVIKDLPIVKVSAIAGTVKAKRGADWVDLKLGDEISEGQIIITRDKSSLELEWISITGLILQMREKSSIKINSKLAEEVFQLNSGEINFNYIANSSSNQKRIEFSTLNSKGGFLGGEISLLSDENQDKYSCSRGSLEISVKDQTVSLKSGFGTIVHDSILEEPVQLLEKVIVREAKQRVN